MNFFQSNCFFMKVFEKFDDAVEKFKKNGLHNSIVAFGSARIKPEDKHYKEIVEISKLCAERIKKNNKKISFMTGGGPAVMEAWLKGGYEVGIQTSGIGIVLPHEQKMNDYCDEKYSCVFNTFAPRKQVFYEYAKAIIVFKGGFGTMDELFEALTLIATKRIRKVPILVYPADFYKDVFNFTTFLEANTIRQDEWDFLTMCKTKEQLLEELYKVIDNS